MPYSDQQREFFQRAKAAGWPAEKIRAGVARLAEREAEAAAQAPAEAPMEAPPPAAQAPAAASAPPQAPAPAPQERSFLGNVGAGFTDEFSGMGRGAQQLYAAATGNKQLTDRLRQEEAANRVAMKDVDSSIGGKVGRVGANALVTLASLIPVIGTAGGAAARGAQGARAALALGSAMGKEAAIGGGMAALAPTVKEGERAENIKLGAALGGALPVAGAAAKKLIGAAKDPAMEAAAKVLKKYDIGTSKADIAPGMLSKAGRAAMEKTPIVGDVLRANSAAKNDKVGDAIFGMMGAERPATAQGMDEIVKTLGEKVGANSAGKKIPLTGVADKVKTVMAGQKMLLPEQRSDEVAKLAKQITDLANAPGVKLRGESYQAIRSNIMSKAESADSNSTKLALQGLAKTLDDAFTSTLGGAEKAAVNKTKEQLRLAKILQKVPIKEGAFDVGAAKRAVDKAAQNGRVMPEARKLLDAADVAIPKVKDSLSGRGLLGGAVALYTPIGKALYTTAVGSRAAAATGAPQAVARSPFTPAILRGINTEYGTGE